MVEKVQQCVVLPCSRSKTIAAAGSEGRKIPLWKVHYKGPEHMMINFTILMMMIIVMMNDDGGDYDDNDDDDDDDDRRDVEKFILNTYNKTYSFIVSACN